MAVHYRTQGIILEKQDVGEADRVFTIFTKDFGKLKLWAISERKITSKLRAGLELFYLSDIEFIQGKSRKTITDASVIARYPIMREYVERIRLMHRFVEIANELIKGQEQDQKIWKLFEQTLDTLNGFHLESRDLKILAYYFLWNLFSYTGYAPSLKEIAARDERVAQFIEMLLESDSAPLQNAHTQGINEPLLQAISQEHLLKVLQN